MQPLLFHPLLKRIRWGGRRLGGALGKPISDGDDWAESWEIADHGHDQSVVDGGPLDGWTLNRLVTEKTEELLGRHGGRRQFPLLIKFLDAHDRLSVQVHPDDRLARDYDPTENGKTEAWVILEADPDSLLYAGLQDGVGRAEFETRLSQGRIEECLHSFPVLPSDVVFVPAGTVHAIGEGILLAEVQQSSDLTFRLYDWDRLGTDGKPRPLHIPEALNATDFDRGPVSPVTPRPLDDAGHDAEELVRCDYFVMQRHRLQSPWTLDVGDRFHVVLVLDGDVELDCEEQRTRLARGRTVLIPASCPDVQFVPRPQTTLLQVFLP